MALQHSPSIVTTDLVYYVDAANSRSYPGTGTILKDISNTAAISTLTNGPTFSGSNLGTFLFDGVDDYINCGSTPGIGSSLTGLTVSVWINTNSASTRCILENGTNYTTNTFYLFQENSNYFTFEVYGTGHDVVYANYVYNLNTWYNLVGVWSAGNRVEMYTNGILTSGTRGGAAQSALINGNTNLMIGSLAGSTYFYSGIIGSIGIYNRALSSPEINQNFNALRGRYGI